VQQAISKRIRTNVIQYAHAQVRKVHDFAQCGFDNVEERLLRPQRTVNYDLTGVWSSNAYLFPILATQEDFAVNGSQIRTMSRDELVQIPVPLFGEFDKF
jgi:hypothetical protein